MKSLVESIVLDDHSLQESIISSNSAGIYPNKDYRKFIDRWSDAKKVGKYDQIYKNFIDVQLGWAETFYAEYIGGTPHIDEIKEVEANLKHIFDALPEWKCLDKFWWFNEKVIKKNGLTVDDLIDGVYKDCGMEIKNVVTDKSLR